MTPDAYNRAAHTLRANLPSLVARALFDVGAWGFHTFHDGGAPGTLSEQRAYLARSGYLCVDGRFSQRTVWGAQHANHAFRAWHDARHLTTGEAFATFEPLTFGAQCADVLALGMGPEHVAILAAETIGQGMHYQTHGEFPVEQEAFTRAFALGLWAGERM